MQKQSDVSVVVPIYNAEAFVERCIKSILKQTLKNIEVICVNDGSTDRTLEILNNFANKDKRLRIINQKNINAGAARNRGLREASGKYVIFLDADDFFEEEMLEKMFNRAEQTHSEVVVVDSDVYLNDKEIFIDGWAIKKELIPKEKVFAARRVKKIFYAFVGWPWDKLFLTSFIKNNELYFQEQQSTNDLYFVYAALVKARRISVIFDILAHHRQNIETSISMNREKSWQCAYKALMKLKEQLIKWNCFDEGLKKCYTNYALKHFIWHFSTLKYPYNKKCYEEFRNKWVKNYGLLNRKKEYFYNDFEYDFLENIMKYSYDEFLLYKISKLEQDINDATDNAKMDKIRIDEQMKHIDEQAKRINELEACVNEEKKHIEEIRASTSMKVGLFATWVPRKIRELIRKVNL